MKFIETHLKGAFVVEIEPRNDSRGFFTRTFCRNEFEAHRMNPNIVQCNLSFNHIKGTLRGMHYQLAPKGEVKYIHCMEGAVYDVIIDLRPDSPTRFNWFGVELTSENRKMLYVPEGFAHGYQALTDGAVVFYQVSEFYSPEHERAVRWNDPFFKIVWPITDPVLSEKDAKIADYKPD